MAPPGSDAGFLLPIVVHAGRCVDDADTRLAMKGQMTRHISRPLRRPVAAGLLLLITGAAQPATHTYVAKEYYTTFSGAHPVALRIKPGDRVITKTIDAGGADWNGVTVAGRGNPETGPFFIEGAEPGDMLVVRLEKIEPNRGTAFSGSLRSPAAAAGCR